MKGRLTTIGIILLILGLLGLMASYSATWMWVLIILGVIGIIWGRMSKGSSTM